MSEVQSYTKLRKDLMLRDRSLREKVVSLEEAASFVRDGDAVRLRRQHDFADADGPDLGADPRWADHPHLFALHRFE